MSAEGNLPAARAAQPRRRRDRGADRRLRRRARSRSPAAGSSAPGGPSLAVASPGRDAVAYVFEARCAAGLCQSLWIGPDMKRAKMAADAEPGRPSRRARSRGRRTAAASASS